MREDVHVPKHDQALSELLQGLQGEVQGEEGMRYRTHPKTGDKISEIGMGSAYLYEAEHDEAIHALRTAYEGGIITLTWQPVMAQPSLFGVRR